MLIQFAVVVIFAIGSETRQPFLVDSLMIGVALL